MIDSLIKDRLFPEKEILDRYSSDLSWKMHSRVHCKSTKELISAEILFLNITICFSFPEDFEQKISQKTKYRSSSPETKDEILEILKKEEEYFNKNNDFLRNKYPNCFVAIKDKEVVDYDLDRKEIGRRVYKKYGSFPILIRHVNSKKKIVLLRSPKLKEDGV